MTAPHLIADWGARALTALDPESAHRMTIRMLKSGLGPKFRVADPRLRVHAAGLSFANPLGIAAGFDKNAEVAGPLLDLGFGFVEVGAATPRPQPGNPKPRVFRLREDAAVINRYGFNNEGMTAIADRLRRRRGQGIVGINLGANKDSEDRAGDYVEGVKGFAGLVDFFTVNISSPNTPGLRALQGRGALVELLTRVTEARDEASAQTPLFLKIAPDLTDADKSDILCVIGDSAIDGLIISNTTIGRPDGLQNRMKGEAGGLSGRPLFRLSTDLLREFYKETKGDVLLVGVGGVFSARDAYEKILAGASLVQLYTALIYEGPSLVARILRNLPEYLHADGFSSIEEAVGAG